jgi:hypothetical protein
LDGLLESIIVRVASEYNSKSDAGFYVSVQPGLSGIRIPDFGRAFLSSLDCFHPSLAADQAFAYQVWNNMQGIFPLPPLIIKTVVSHL